MPFSTVPLLGALLRSLIVIVAVTPAYAQVPAPLPKPDLRLKTAGMVFSLAAQPGGEVALVGGFTSVDGVPRNGLARRLPDGSVDPQWAPRAGWGDEPQTFNRELVALPDGSVLLHSDANTMDGQPYALCGVKFAPGAPATFSLTWHQQAGCPDEVTVADSGRFFRSGMGGYQVVPGNLATGAIDWGWATNWSGQPQKMVYDGTGGLIVSVPGTLDSYGTLSRVLVATGQVDTAWQAPPVERLNGVTEFAVDPAEGALYVAYWYKPVAKLSLSTGQPFAGWSAGFHHYSTWALSLDAERNVLVGGSHGLAKLSRLSGALLNHWEADGIYGSVYDLALLGDGTTLIAGGFAKLGETTALGLARLPVSAAQPLADAKASRPGTIDVLARLPDGGLIVAGVFDNVEGMDRRRLLRLLPDGNVDPNWKPVPNGDVRSVAVDSSGNVYILGNFTLVDEVSRDGIAKLDGLTGGVVTSWDPYPPTAITAIALDAADRVYLIPRYTSEVAAYRVLPDGSDIDATWSPGGVDSTGRGAFATNGYLYVRTAANPSDTQYVRRIALETGQLDTQWSVTLRSADWRWSIPRMIGTPDGDLVIAGQFDQVNGVARKGIARVSTTVPSQVRSWNPQPSGFVADVTTSADGRIFVAGSFTDLGGKPRGGIAEIALQDGSTIDTWNAPVGGARIEVSGNRVNVVSTTARGLLAYPLDIGDTVFATHFD